MKREDVIQILQCKYSELTEQYHVTSLSIFGSVARDEAGLDSDVDILVEFARPVGLFHFIELQQRLEALLKCKVDLGTQRSLKLKAKDHALQEAIRVF